MGRACGRHGEKRIVGWEYLRTSLEDIWVDGRIISNQIFKTEDRFVGRMYLNGNKKIGGIFWAQH